MKLDIKFSEVEKGVPMPDSSNGPKRHYPFMKMEVGDSFEVTSLNGQTIDELRNRVSASTASANRNYKPKHFIVRSLTTSVRVWRDQ